MTKDKFWRTLVRVCEITETHIGFLVIGWSIHEVVFLKITDLPKEIMQLMSIDQRFHAKVNIDAELAQDLIFTEWETE